MTNARPGSTMLFLCKHPVQNVHFMHMIASVLICVQAAQGAGMLSVAVPPALSARGRFPAAQVTFDGFGYGGGLKWPRLQMLLDKRLAGKV